MQRRNDPEETHEAGLDVLWIKTEVTYLFESAQPVESSLPLLTDSAVLQFLVLVFIFQLNILRIFELQVMFYMHTMLAVCLNDMSWLQHK